MNLGIKNIWTGGGGVSPTELEVVKTKVDSLSNVAAKTNISNTFTANQNINGQVKVSASAESIVINGSGDKFIAFKNGNTREAYIGRPAAGSGDYEFKCSTGYLKLTAGDNRKVVLNSDVDGVNRNITILNLVLGFGGQASISPDTGTNKTLQFKYGDKKFSALDLTNDVKLKNVPNIKSVTVQNISQNGSKTHNLPAGSIVLSIYNNSTGKNNPNFVIKDNGELTITNNNDGILSSYVVKYWEV